MRLGLFARVGREVMSMNRHDEVSRPAHYTAGGVECIDAIAAALSPEEFRGFLKGNAMKYLWRERLKHEDGGATDLRKALWYLDRLVGLGVGRGR